jgi:hypothetical protein
MNKQQTAVEWLVNQLQKTRDWQRVINEANESSSSVRDVIQEAREMEKEQMIDFGAKCLQSQNETYGGNNHLCCTPEGQIKRYVNCIGCDRKPLIQGGNK